MIGFPSGAHRSAVKAVEAIDLALGRLVDVIEAADGAMLVTADHGNLEEMWDAHSGQVSTQHSTNPVPLVYVANQDRSLRESGSLRDIAPTILELMGLPLPAQMSGQSLLNPAE